MTLVIIAPDNHIQNTLKQALSGLSEDVQAYKQTSEIPQKLSCTAAISIIDKSNAKSIYELAKTVPVFGFVSSDFQIEEENENEFVFLSKVPIRLGSFVNLVQTHLKNRKQKDKMKPVILGHFVLDPRSNNLENKKTNKSIRLTEKEQDMLLFLFGQNGKPVTKEKLLDNVWGYAQGVETHTLETHIYRLRQKVEKDPAAPTFLVTDDKGYFLKL